jgi:hypothetical protein
MTLVPEVEFRTIPTPPSRSIKTGEDDQLYMLKDNMDLCKYKILASHFKEYTSNLLAYLRATLSLAISVEVLLTGMNR